VSPSPTVFGWSRTGGKPGAGNDLILVRAVVRRPWASSTALELTNITHPDEPAIIFIKVKRDGILQAQGLKAFAGIRWICLPSCDDGVLADQDRIRLNLAIQINPHHRQFNRGRKLCSIWSIFPRA